MYYIIAKENAYKHEIKFFPTKAEVSIYSFSFENKCLDNFDIR